MDKLTSMFDHQYKLQERLNVWDRIKGRHDMKQQYINQMILAIHEEAVEIMRETAYKNPGYVPFGWKVNQEPNNERFKEEIVDILHFVINLSLVSGMSPDELYRRYLGKNKENFKRQDNKY